MLGTSLSPGVLAGSFAQVTFTDDPLAGSVFAEARHAAAVGLLKPVIALGKMYDLGALNKVLRAAGQRPVRA
jgi:NitT/TauT family transport system substrate-binding protein